MARIARALAIFGAVALFFSPFAAGTPEYSKKESKQCTYCHTALGKPDLNDAGRYYKEHNYSLEGYVERKRIDAAHTPVFLRAHQTTPST